MKPSQSRQHLIDNGRLDPRTGATRKAKPGHCRRCGLSVVGGLDGDVCAMVVAVDPAPLADDAAEIAAMLDGLDTFTWFRGEDEIDRRDRWRREDYPAAGVIFGRQGHYSVHAGHRCAVLGGAA